jgi:hypothetical protein
VGAVGDRTEHLAVAVVRAWIEAAPPGALKIRIVTSPGLRKRGRTLGVASDAEEACAIIRKWLDAFTSEVRRAEGG